jgi:ketol-acid reductoisomerase
MYYSVSDTAEYGGMSVGPKVIDETTEAKMKEVLKRVQDGTFAREFIMENQTGRAVMTSLRRQHEELQIEKVGKELRGMMSWIKR